MKKILIATKNKGKIAEFTSLFSHVNIQVISLLDLNEDEQDIEETGNTFKENAALKAETIAKAYSIPVLADDSGLIVDALGGDPGIYSARYAGEDTDDQANNALLLKNMSKVDEDERTARFICVLAVAIPNDSTHYYTGYCEGAIATKQTGINGFGYDPLFIPDGFTKTMAELSQSEKNTISHRSAALALLEKDIKTLFVT